MIQIVISPIKKKTNVKLLHYTINIEDNYLLVEHPWVHWDTEYYRDNLPYVESWVSFVVYICNQDVPSYVVLVTSSPGR